MFSQNSKKKQNIKINEITNCIDSFYNTYIKQTSISKNQRIKDIIYQKLANIILLQIELEDEYNLNHPQTIIKKKNFDSALKLLRHRSHTESWLKQYVDQWKELSNELYCSIKNHLQSHLKTNKNNTERKLQKIHNKNVIKLFNNM
ncbi:MAG: hypothetical protein ACI4V7_02600 [Succinivibrionaceae bacterium]